MHIFISNPAKLGIKNKNLHIMPLQDSRSESIGKSAPKPATNPQVSAQNDIFLPLDSLSSVVVDNPVCTLTHAFLSHAAECGILVITCDEKRLPSGIFLPFSRHSKATLHAKAQIKLTKSLKPALWQGTIKAKIANAKKALEMLEKPQHRDLARLEQKVLLGDSTNIEALAARIYFEALFGGGFKRREDSALNGLLNYGYAILRAHIARNIAAHGLLGSFGIHHDNQLNAFNLADDLLEPFRAFVDFAVFEYAKSRESCEVLEKSDKIFLLGILEEKLDFCGRILSLENAIDAVVGGFLRVVLGKAKTLDFPTFAAKNRESCARIRPKIQPKRRQSAKNAQNAPEIL